MAANKLLKEQIKDILILYKKGESITQIANLYNVSYVNVRMLLKRRNLINVNPKHKRVHNPDLLVNIFEIIDTEFKAYLLGLICADGHISNMNVEISLQATDKDLLEKIKIKINHITPLIKKVGTGNRQDIYRLFLCSKKMAEDLRKLGLTNNKTQELNISILQHIPSYLLRDFVRGFFDGDGCITHNKGDYEMGIIGHQDFIIPLQKLLSTTLNIHVGLSLHKTPYIRTLRIAGRFQCIKFSEWMYAGSEVFMKRKFNKYQDLLESIKENPCGKLTSKDYEIIRLLYKTGKHTKKDLSEIFKISVSHISRILKGYTFKNSINIIKNY